MSGFFNHVEQDSTRIVLYPVNIIIIIADNLVTEEITAVSMATLLSADTSKYYRYNGSLTTPGCFESVVWSVFDKPRPISARQVSNRYNLAVTTYIGEAGKQSL